MDVVVGGMVQDAYTSIDSPYNKGEEQQCI